MVSWNGDLGQLKRGRRAVAVLFRPGLDQLFLQARRRPNLHRRRRRGRASEFAEIVSERVELKANRVGREGLNRQPRPLRHSVRRKIHTGDSLKMFNRSGHTRNS